ncbi:TetR/AcrR family transcriptional regulator [Paenibacillus sp. KQZ6P-2]|uniref:TetR/AcrR family transcriptional regulator n=1 Tax=Paenibacillus mangrovi TaxID=2931978 RepID=A0A9X1WRQ4_9BACL|nr:TetR/AcrR family transcriptional regulator [Paenibacillus mangrovi]MCJ8012388.1 TetR/AcrR family transcriptional regulator [Paenibacillus mangrovi]
MNSRVLKTKISLMNALLDLMSEKKYESITVRDIVQKAGINRSTFYLHFLDKEDLKEQNSNFILDKLREAIQYPSFNFEEAIRDYEERQQPISSLLAIFRHIQEYFEFYSVMLGEKEFQQKLDEMIKEELFKFSIDKIRCAYNAGGLIGLIRYWVSSDMEKSPEHMAKWVTQVILYPNASQLNE